MMSCTVFPRVEVSGPGVEIGGPDLATIELVRRDIEESVAQVRAFLPATRDEPVVFRLQDSVAGGITSDRDLRGAHLAIGGFDWVLLDVDVVTQNTIVHECVHALLGERWRGLPKSIEEGLAEYVARELTDDEPDHEAGMAAALWQLVPGLDARLVDASTDDVLVTFRSVPTKALSLERLYAIDTLDLWFMDRDDFAYAYVTSAFLVRRIVERWGLDGLLELCERSSARGQCTVALDDVLAAAELTRDFASWTAPASDALDERTVQAIGKGVVPRLVEWLGDDLTDVDEVALEMGAVRVLLGSGADLLKAERDRAESAHADSIFE